MVLFLKFILKSLSIYSILTFYEGKSALTLIITVNYLNIIDKGIPTSFMVNN